jgi:hypothetical protein
MRMGIFGADYQFGRLLAGVAIAHGRGEGAMTPTGLDRAYSAHSSMTTVHPYAAFDLSEDLTLWGHSNLGLMVDATLNLLVAHQDSRYREWGFSGSVRFDPGMAGRGLSLDLTPSFGSAAQGAGRLWAMQDLGGLAPYSGVPFDLGGQFAAELGYGMTGPGGRGAGRPYAGLTQAGMGYRAVRYGYRWEVDQHFNVGVEGARQDSGGAFAPPLFGGDRGGFGGANHSVQLRGGVKF